ncbi:unnamed protein product [Blepharisma stoltei]|uniref:Thioredoxin domain-containing protein n=1 Tax=Blepharisma stoltei TaxID=1481888 RepID=A0AAU9IKF8_9CILI|nr:unnamed protein product [Blepharisma stoltei]
MAISLLLGILLTLEANAMIDMDFQEGFKRISQIKDEVSIDLNDTNFDTTISTSNSPWFIYFFHPQCFKCTIFSPQWKFFAEDAKKQSHQINIAKVNILANPKLAQRFMISTFPNFLYYTDGYIYNYTGKTDSRELKLVYLNHTYLMYDRKELPPPITLLREAYNLARFLFKKISSLYYWKLLPIVAIFIGVFYFILKCCKTQRKLKIE